MSANNNQVANVNQENQVGAPDNKHYEYDSGWRQEPDGSRWREKGESDYQKTENNSEDGWERKESYSSKQSSVWTSGDRQ